MAHSERRFHEEFSTERIVREIRLVSPDLLFGNCPTAFARELSHGVCPGTHPEMGLLESAICLRPFEVGCDAASRRSSRSIARWLRFTRRSNHDFSFHDTDYVQSRGSRQKFLRGSSARRAVLQRRVRIGSKEGFLKTRSQASPPDPLALASIVGGDGLAPRLRFFRLSGGSFGGEFGG